MMYEAACDHSVSLTDHIPYCPHRNNKPAGDCLWCETEYGYDPFENVPRLFGAGKTVAHIAKGLTNGD